MSLNRYARRRDRNEPDIIEAVAKAGWSCWRLDRPCDLLVWKEGRGFMALEVKVPHGKKSPKAVIDKRQEEQNDFLARTNAARVTTAEEALRFLGEIR